MLELKELELLWEGAKSLGVELNERQLQQFSTFTDVLLEWNQKFNLTRITEPGEMVVKHFLDSLSCLSAAEFPLDAKVVDVGSGAGFPGIPIEIARPDLNLTLVDATRKRVAFLDAALEELGLAGAQILHARAEEAGQDRGYRGLYDIALARAVARTNILVEYCLPLLRIGGFAIAQKGPDVDDELKEAETAMRRLGGEVEKMVHLTLPGSDLRRTLIVIRKLGPTPSVYPRRPSVIQKLPL